MEQPHTDIHALERLKAKRHRRKILQGAILVLALAGGIAYATGFFSASMAVLGDAVDTAYLLMSRGKGYPADLPVSGFLQSAAVGSCTAVLGDNDVVVLSSSAKESLRVQHGYASPCLTTGKARLCIYNRGSTELQVLSRTRSLFSKKFDKEILFASMSPGGVLAVATKSERYLAQVTVFNTGFQEIYTWYSASDYPSSVTFAQDNRRFAVVCPKAENGALGSVITLLDTRKSDVVCQISAPGSLAVKLKYLPGNELLVVYDNMCAVYNSETGEEKARYSYDGRSLLYANAEKGKNMALVFGNESKTSLNEAVVLSSSLQEVCNVPYGKGIYGLVLTRDRLYLMGEASVDAYNLKGEALHSQALSGRGDRLVYSKKLLAFTSKEISAVT